MARHFVLTATGFSLAWGIFQEYLAGADIRGDKGSIAVIGTTSSV